MRPGSVTIQALDVAFSRFAVCVSKETLAELRDVLQRTKFVRYQSSGLRQAFVDDFAQRASLVDVQSSISDCIDPKDNKFLALVLDARASLILASDKVSGFFSGVLGAVKSRAGAVVAGTADVALMPVSAPPLAHRSGNAALWRRSRN